MSFVSRSRKPRSVKAAILASLLAVFVMDVFLPLVGISVGVPYVLVLLLTLWLPNRKDIFRAAGLITILALIGIFFPMPAPEALWIAVLNRSIVLFVVWVTAILGNLLLREQEATRQERDFNESLVETASSIILLLDTEGKIVYFNRNTTDWVGYELSRVVGQDWFDLCIAEHDRARARHMFLKCLETGEGRDSLMTLTGRGGKELQFSFTSKPMRDVDDRIVQVLFVGQDVTMLLEAQRRMVATERLAAIGQTIAAVSHESRNELMALKLGLDMLSTMITDPKSQHLLDHLQNSQGRLHRLLDDLRHFAGPMQLERAPCSLQDIWMRAWSSLKTLRKDREAELHEMIEPHSLHCEVDALRIEQVFRNLFENSLSACSDPVWIEIRVAEEPQEGQLFLRVSVRDNGPGLSPEARAKVFEPFFTTKQRGTGLGMAISQRIVKAHGGDLCVSNSNKRGAEFVLLLPLDTVATPVEAVIQS